MLSYSTINGIPVKDMAKIKGISEDRLGEIVQRLPIGTDFLDHRLQLGIFPADPRNLRRGRARVQLRFEKLEPFGDLRKFVQRNHARGVARMPVSVKGHRFRPPPFQLCENIPAGGSPARARRYRRVRAQW